MRILSDIVLQVILNMLVIYRKITTEFSELIVLLVNVCSEVTLSFKIFLLWCF